MTADVLFPGFDAGVVDLPDSVQTGTNADLLAAVAPLYLAGSVLDVTFGTGRFWHRFRPPELTFHDLALDGVDFRDLPHGDGSFESVVFDPPYIPQGGVSSRIDARPNERAFRGLFGLDRTRTDRELWGDLIRPGLSEVVRVSSRWVLAKCCDYVDGKGLVLGHVRMIDAGESLGARLHDLIVFTFERPGPGGHQIFDAVRTRRAHSYLVVFEVGS